MISHQIKTALLASTMLSCAFASQSFADSDRAATRTIVANLHLADGSTVQFQSDKNGSLGVAAQGVLRKDKGSRRLANINGINIAELEKLSATQLYKRLTGGSQAPAALIAAEARATVATTRESSGSTPKNAKKLPSKAARGAQRETTLSCVHDTLWKCWYSITGSYDFWWKNSYMRSYVEVYQWPSVYHKLSLWDGFNWNFAIDQWVGPGNWGYIWWSANSGWDLYKRVEVSGDGSAYDWFVNGH
jgi:hypothetical protein